MKKVGERERRNLWLLVGEWEREIVVVQMMIEESFHSTLGKVRYSYE